MNAEYEKKISAFETWCCRRLPRSSWKDYVNNETVLARIGEDQKIITDDIKNRKMKCLVHKIRENGIFMPGVQENIYKRRHQEGDGRS